MTKEIYSVDKGIRLWEMLPKRIKYTFVMTFLIGLIAHGFAFVNKIPNNDDLYNIRAYGATLGHGRWFQSFLGPVMSKFGGNYTNPWILGLVTLFFLAIASCFVVEVFEIQSIYGSVLIGGIMVTFPPIIGNFAYMFSAPYYSFSILLISISAYFFVRKDRAIYSFVAILLVACSMGIYQAYYPFLAGVLLIVLIKKAFCIEGNVGELFKTAIKYVSVLILCMVAYFVILKFMLTIFQTSLAGHHGIDTMGSISLSMIPGIVVRIYKNTFAMIYSDYMGISADLLIQMLVGCSFLATVIFIIVKAIHLIRERKWGSLIMGLFFVLIFPIAINLIDIMCASAPQGSIYTLMQYGLLLIFALPIVLWENISSLLLQYCVAIAGTFVIIYYVNLANEAYLYAYLSNTAVESFYTTVITQIRSQEGYTSDMEIVFEGLVQEDAIYPLYGEFQNIHIPSFGSSVNRANETTEGLLKYYCGFYPEFGRECAVEYAEEVKNMSCYPDAGSIRILGNQVVVKFSE